MSCKSGTQSHPPPTIRCQVSHSLPVHSVPVHTNNSIPLFSQVGKAAGETQVQGGRRVLQPFQAGCGGSA